MKRNKPSDIPTKHLRVGEPFNPFGLFTGIWIPEALLSLKIAPSAKLLYGRLARYAGKQGLCFPSQKTLARDLGLEERQIRNLLQVLVEHGYLHAVDRGLGNSNWYQFLWHRDLRASLKRDHRQDITGAKPAIKNRHKIASKEKSSEESPSEESQGIYQVKVLNRSATRANLNTTSSSEIANKRNPPRFERARRATALPQNSAAPLPWGASKAEDPDVAKVQDALFVACGKYLGYPDPQIAERVLLKGLGAPPTRVCATIQSYGRRMAKGDKPIPRTYGLFLAHVGDYFKHHPEARKPFLRRHREKGSSHAR